MKKLAIFAPNEKKDLGAPLGVVVKTILIFLVSQVLASLIVAIILAAMHPGQSAAQLLDDSIPGQFFYVLLAEGAAVGLVFLIVRYRRLSFSSIGLGRRPKFSDLWRALGGFVIFYGLLIIASVLVKAFLPGVNTNQQQNLGFNNITTTADNVLTFFALVILPPLGEEPLVRGYLFGGLRARWKFWPAAVVTSVLFCLPHIFENGNGQPLLWTAGIDTFILSLVLVKLRENTGALYAGILVHMLNNLVAFGVHFH